jgi:hypothetical protein
MNSGITKSFIFLLLIGSLINLVGCVNVEQTIYLGDAKVKAPISPPPTHLNVNKEVGSVTISPRFSIIKSNTTIKGTTDDSYTDTFRFSDSLSYVAPKENLTWNVSQYIIGADIDYKLSKGFSIFGGINLAGNGNNRLWGGNVGIGIHNHDKNPIVRLDLGLTIQRYDFDAVTIVHTKTESVFGSEEHWDIFADRGSSTNINPFGALTVNSANDSSLFNWFATGGFFTQNLLGFDPGTHSYPLFPFVGTYTLIDTRSDMLAGFLFFNPGIMLSINPGVRLVISARMLSEVLNTNSSQIFIMPSVQIDFQL